MRFEEIPCTPQRVVDELYEILEICDGVLSKNRVDHTVACGTMLGAVRHKGLIPWDDDADIFVLGLDIVQLADLMERHGGNTIKVDSCRYSLRVYVDNAHSRTEGAGFPFVELIPVEKKESGKITYVCDKACRKWPKEWVSSNAFSRLERVEFGHLSLLSVCQNERLEFLDRSYGPDWRTLANRQWDHLNNVELPPEKVPIESFDCAKHSKCYI
jgi:lipopolysaccharide cholinephosphotransferase